MCYDCPQSDFIVTSLQPQPTTSFHGRCPTGQLPPFASIAYMFCPTDIRFPPDCPEVHVQHTSRAIHAAVCFSVFVTYCFHTFWCDLQTSLTSEYCCKPGPPAEPCGTRKKHEVTGDSKFMTTFGHHQLNSLFFFYYISCTYHTL